MSGFAHTFRDRRVVFSDHALDRWWERRHGTDHYGRRRAMNDLRHRLDHARVLRVIPEWARLRPSDVQRAELVILLPDGDTLFVVNRNRSGDLVAVTCLTRLSKPAGVVASRRLAGSASPAAARGLGAGRKTRAPAALPATLHAKAA